MHFATPAQRFLALHSPKAKSMSLARFSRHPWRKQAKKTCLNKISRLMYLRARPEGIGRRSFAEAKQPPRQVEGKKLGDVVMADKLLPRNARTLVLGLIGIPRGEPGRAANAGGG